MNTDYVMLWHIYRVVDSCKSLKQWEIYNEFLCKNKYIASRCSLEELYHFKKYTKAKRTELSFK